MYGISTVLFTTDFSEFSRPAFAVAEKMARAHDARLILLHVVDPRIQAGELGVVLPITQPTIDQLLAQLDDFKSQAPEIAAEKRVTQGDVVDEILRIAGEEHCDLIVMSTHGRKGLGRFLLGSVTEQVLRRAPCPVLTVRAQLELAAQPALVPEHAAAT